MDTYMHLRGQQCVELPQPGKLVLRDLRSARLRAGGAGGALALRASGLMYYTILYYTKLYDTIRYDTISYYNRPARSRASGAGAPGSAPGC